MIELGFNFIGKCNFFSTKCICSGRDLSQDTAAGDPTSDIPCLGHQCPMVVKGLVMSSLNVVTSR